MSDIYVRVGPDGEWHWLGIATEGIEIKREYLEKEGRMMIASEGYYVEIKP